MDEGQLSPDILPWINGLPDVRRMLAEKFPDPKSPGEGSPINEQNLSEWRYGGYVEWERERDRIENTKRLAEYAVELAKASGGTIGEGGVAIAAGKILEKLEGVEGEA